MLRRSAAPICGTASPIGKTGASPSSPRSVTAASTAASSPAASTGWGCSWADSQGGRKPPHSFRKKSTFLFQSIEHRLQYPHDHFQPIVLPPRPDHPCERPHRSRGQHGTGLPPRGGWRVHRSGPLGPRCRNVCERGGAAHRGHRPEPDRHEYRAEVQPRHLPPHRRGCHYLRVRPLHG